MNQAPDRRTALADAAVSVLADGGMRALTHRAVDAAAGLPAGTTSAYLRTRKALLSAVVARLVQLDQAELEAAGAGASLPDGPDELAALIAAFCRDQLGPGRRRALARYACVVESVHHAELREILRPRENAARAGVEAFLVAHGVERAEAAGRTVTFLHCIDGLVFGRLVDERGGSRELFPEIRALLAIALRGPGEG